MDLDGLAAEGEHQVELQEGKATLTGADAQRCPPHRRLLICRLGLLKRVAAFVFTLLISSVDDEEIRSAGDGNVDHVGFLLARAARTAAVESRRRRLITSPARLRAVRLVAVAGAGRLTLARVRHGDDAGSEEEGEDELEHVSVLSMLPRKSQAD